MDTRDPHPAASSVPDALQLLITKRFEMLARAEQRVLEVASLAGDVFATAAVAAGLEVPVAQVDAICDTLGQQRASWSPAQAWKNDQGTRSPDWVLPVWACAVSPGPVRAAGELQRLRCTAASGSAWRRAMVRRRPRLLRSWCAIWCVGTSPTRPRSICTRLGSRRCTTGRITDAAALRGGA